MKLSIIIPHFIINKEIFKLAKDNLKSIKKYTNVPYEIVNIDNASSKYNHWIRKNSDTYIRNEKNLGNGTGWQQGALSATGKYLCFMDNDVKVSRSWIKPLIDLLQDKKVAVAFPMSKNKEDDDYFERLAGFCWVIRRDLYHKINNSIEEKFKIQDWEVANFEDTSFFMSCKLAGYLLKCSTKSKINHYSRATCDKVLEVATLYPKNEEKYFNKYKILPLLD